MDYQVVRSLPDFHLFVGCHMVFTLATIPLVVSSERLLHHEVVEAVVDGDGFRARLHLEPTCLILVSHDRLLDQLHVSLRLAAPLCNEDKVSVL